MTKMTRYDVKTNVQDRLYHKKEVINAAHSKLQTTRQVTVKEWVQISVYMKRKLECRSGTGTHLSGIGPLCREAYTNVKKRRGAEDGATYEVHVPHQYAESRR